MATSHDDMDVNEHNGEDIEADDGENGDAQDGENGDSKPVKRVAGSNLLRNVKCLTNSGAIKIPLTLNTDRKPVGKHSSLFANYLGYLARSMIPITYGDWRKVPNETKTCLYETLKRDFDIQLMDRKGILSDVGTKWNSFKGRLKRDHIIDKENGGYLTHPPDEYSFIEQEAWTSFIQNCITPEHKEKSEANRRCALKKQYIYKGGSMGYARMEHNILIEKKLDPLWHTIHRSDLWVTARVDHKGLYDADTTIVVKKIAAIKEQKAKGTIEFGEREDELSLALEKKEHSGRIRGAGYGIGVKKFYGKINTKCSSSQENVQTAKMVSSLVERISELEKWKASRSMCSHCSQQEQVPTTQPINQVCTANTYEQVVVGDIGSTQEIEEHPTTSLGSPKLNQHINQVCTATTSDQDGVGDIGLTQETEHPPTSLGSPKENIKNCRLLPDIASEVAEGRVFVPISGYTSLLHGKQLNPKVSLKVMVELVIDEQANLPYPTDEISLLSEAIGSLIEWPTSLVILEENFNQSSKGTKQSDHQSINVDKAGNDKHDVQHSVQSSNCPKKSDHQPYNVDKADNDEHDDVQNCGRSSKRLKKSDHQPMNVDKPKTDELDVQNSVQRKCTKKSVHQSKDVDNNSKDEARNAIMNKCLVLASSDDEISLTMNISKEVLQYNHSVMILKDHLQAWITRTKLEAPQIIMYIKFLHYKFRPALYKFFCPLRVAYIVRSNDDPNIDKRVHYMSSTMCENKECLWLVPYHESNHWMLAVIDLKTATVYWLDPLKNNPVSTTFKQLCGIVLAKYYYIKSNRLGPKMRWKDIKCPKQDDSFSCGFYICHFMRDILESGKKEISIKYFSPSPAKYSDAQINEVIYEGVEVLGPILD